MPGIFDVSIILNENTPVYPGDPELKIQKLKTIPKDGYELSEVCMGVHTGTHIDAPSHFFAGRLPAEALPLDILIGKAVVLEFANDEFISATDLRAIDFKDYTRVIFKTRNSSTLTESQFSEDYIYLDKEAGEYLAKKGIKLVGFDYYSLDKYNSDMPVHKLLLEKDIIIIEGLDLSTVEAGEYELLALPLKISTEGAPARVVLRQFVRGDIPS